MTKKKMFINNSKLILTLGIINFIMVLLFTSCQDTFNPLENQPLIENGYGMINISFFDGNASVQNDARTVFPSMNFDKYEYTFVKNGNGNGIEKNPDKNGFFSLEIGNYIVAVHAYIKVDESFVLAAFGESNEFTVGQGINTTVNVSLVEVNNLSSGKLTYTINLPTGANTEITLQRWQDMEYIVLNPVNVTNGTGKTQTLELEPGSYLLSINVSKNHHMTGISEAIHIKPFLTTVYTKVFTDNDFLLSQYTITFDINNATSGVTPVSQTVFAGSSIILPSKGSLDKIGYLFGGWNTAYDGSGINYNASNSYTVTDSTTLYAKWNNSYSISGSITLKVNNQNPTNAWLLIYENADCTIPIGDGSAIPINLTDNTWSTQIPYFDNNINIYFVAVANNGSRSSELGNIIINHNNRNNIHFGTVNIQNSRTLTNNQWLNGIVADSNSVSSHTLSVSAYSSSYGGPSAIYLWINDRDNSTKTGKIAFRYRLTGTGALGSIGNYDSGWTDYYTYSSQSISFYLNHLAFDVTYGQPNTYTLSIDIQPYNVIDANTGTYSIVYNTTGTKPSTSSVIPALSGSVVINGIAQVGQELTANTTSLGGSGTITYQWKRGSTNIGANSNKYTVVTDDLGSSITLNVTRANNSGIIISDPTAIVAAADALPGTVTITGNVQVGQILTANISSLGGNGTISYLWKKGDTVIGTDNTYLIKSDDIGSTITVNVNRVGYSSGVSSMPTTVVPPVLTGNIIIYGTTQVGQTLSVNTSSLSGTGTLRYQWNRNSTTNLSTNSTYILTESDAGSIITVTVIRDGYSGSVTSNPTNTIIAALPTQPRNFLAIPRDKHVTLSWTVPQSNGGGAITGYQVTMDNWGLNTVTVTGTTHTFTNITNGTGYTFRVRAINSTGNSTETTTTTPSTFTNATSMYNYLNPLATNTQGNVISQENPIFISVNMNLGDMRNTFGIGWVDLMNQISLANKFVELDLSSCHVEYNTFDPKSGSGRSRIVSLIVPNVATTIGALITSETSIYDAFTNLRSISGAEVTLIRRLAFYEVKSLENINFPNLVSIGEGAFSYCEKLTSLHFPEVISIGTAAFQHCTGINSIYFPKATNIGGAAFYSCISLTSVSLPKATIIGEELTDGFSSAGVFARCTSLTSVNLPEATYIGSFTFRDTLITSASFPKATTIANYAFIGTVLSELNIPSATSIGRDAFRETGNKTLTINLGTSVPKLGITLFWNVDTSKTVIINVPSGTSGYGSSPVDSTSYNWGNAFRGIGWNGSNYQGGIVNTNINLSIVYN